MSSVDQRVAKRCSESGVVRIGLVNNMPPGACSTTERQFTQILAEAGSDYAVELQCFRTFRSGAGTELSPMEAIRGANLDGMIVTGAEPQSLSLRSEPIWPLITRLVDLGYERDLPIMWSCLAAHAAILYLDGIDRVRLDYKMSGLFAGAAIAPDHPLLEGLADGWAVPHSRCNDLPEATLAANGYRVLVRSHGAGVDLFEKVSKPGFVFLQSHPEYDADSLWREVHRDVRRFLSGERHEAPALPQYCLGSVDGAMPHFPGDWSLTCRENTEAILAWLSRCCDQSVRAPWRTVAVRFFRNWVRSVAAQKAGNSDRAAQLAGHVVLRQDLRHPGFVPC
jgi:homoserine O-succinyltransferase